MGFYQDCGVMSLLDTEIGLPVSTGTIVTRAANEGIPVAAIARIVQQPFEAVSDHLKGSLATGRIGSMPKSDWPPSARLADRLPTVPRSAHPEDVEFQCKRLFKLTKLEASFMMVCLRYDLADKERLHAVIEEQRARRPLRPDKQEATDPKMVDVVICKLRGKLKKIDEHIVLHTSRGSGYYFENETKQSIMQMLGGPYAIGPEAQRGSDTGSAVERERDHA